MHKRLSERRDGWTRFHVLQGTEVQIVAEIHVSSHQAPGHLRPKDEGASDEAFLRRLVKGGANGIPLRVIIGRETAAAGKAEKEASAALRAARKESKEK